MNHNLYFFKNEIKNLKLNLNVMCNVPCKTFPNYTDGAHMPSSGKMISDNDIAIRLPSHRRNTAIKNVQIIRQGKKGPA